VLVEVCRDQLGGPFVGRVENSGVLYTVPTGQLHRFKPSAVTDLLCKLWATTRPYQDLVQAPGDQLRPPTVTKAYEVFTTVPVYASQALFVDGSVAGVLKDALPVVGKVRARALQLFRVFVGEALDSSGNGEFPPALHPHVRYILRACFLVPPLGRRACRLGRWGWVLLKARLPDSLGLTRLAEPIGVAGALYGDGGGKA